MYKIEKNLAIPTRHNRRQSKYPWADLQIGDSFLVPFNEVNVKNERSNLHTSYRQWCRTRQLPERKISVQEVEKGFRVWRVS